ncbi:MAG: tetratricopeptide repeat protein [Bacteroidota bacterium]
MKKNWIASITTACLSLLPLSCSAATLETSSVYTDHSSVSYQCEFLRKLTKNGDTFYDQGKHDKGNYDEAHQRYYQAIYHHLKQKSLCGSETLNNFLYRKPLNLPNYQNMRINISYTNHKNIRCQLAQTINNLGMVYQVHQPTRNMPFKWGSAQERYKIALYCYEQSLKIRNEFPLPDTDIGKSRHNIGGALINLKSYDAAIGWLKTSLITSWKEKTDAIDTKYLLALAYEMNGEHQKAKNDYNAILYAILSLKNVPPSIQETKREIEERLKNLEKSTRHLRKHSQLSSSQKAIGSVLPPPKPKKPTITPPMFQIAPLKLAQPNTAPKRKETNSLSMSIKLKEVPKFDIKKELPTPPSIKKRPFTPCQDKNHTDYGVSSTSPTKKSNPSPKKVKKAPTTDIQIPPLTPTKHEDWPSQRERV